MPAILLLLAVLLLAAPAPAQEPPRRLRILASGDILPHSPVYGRARANAGGRGYDFRPMFRFLTPRVREADLALCHAETPIGAGAPTGYPTFNAPAALAPAIAATGWDVCSIASNHSLDKGRRGISATRRALARAGIARTGAFTSGAQRAGTTMLTAHGVRVAFLAYTEMTNGIPLPDPWSVNLARPGRILADARRARRRGARVVVVNLHWGQEYRRAPSAFQLALARRLAASPDVTAIVGQHAHVVQPIRFLGRTPVVFGEGNLLSNQSSACCPAASQDGLMALLDVAVGRTVRVERVEYVPTWVRHPDYAVLPVGDALEGRLASRSALRASWRRTVAAAGRSERVRPVPSRLPG